MADHLVCFAEDKCFLVEKLKAAANVCGVSMSMQQKDRYPRDAMLFPRFPSLCTPIGFFEGSNASLRYIGTAYPVRELYGTSASEKLAIDSALDAISAELEVPLIAATRGADRAKVEEDMMKTLEHLDRHLTRSTFLVGHRMSIADISLSAAVKAALDEQVLKNVSGLVGLARLVNTVAGRSGMAVKIEAAKKDVAAAEKDKAAAEKDKAAAAAVAAEGKPAPKIRDPIDDLPETNFDMDAWKRKYSNTKDYRGDAMPYLWEKLDYNGWSFWHFHYQRYSQEENTKGYKASNLVGMFLQRIDNWLRKYMFGVCQIFEIPTADGSGVEYYDIEGVFLVRGLEVPKRLADHDQFESFTWKKLEVPKDKELIEEFFCADEEIQGKKIADAKVYK